MRNPLLSLILSLLTAVVFTSCNDIDTPAEKTGDVRFTFAAFDFQIMGRTGARMEATSTWKHIYADNAVLNITNKTNGQKYTLQYNPNDFSEAFRITLPFGNYAFESTVEGDVFESFLPYTLEGEFTLNSQSLDISLSATTDYSLVTVKNQFVTEASISASGLEAESLSLLKDESYHYVYVEGGTLANLQITESYQGTLIERSITVAAYIHYNFVFQMGQGTANIIDLVMDAFGYEEEEIFIGVKGLPSYLPKNGLVAWYPFNGNANDESGNGNDGTLNGVGIIPYEDRFGLLNSSYNFDGSNSSIIVSPSNSLNFTQNITISSWIFITGNSSVSCCASDILSRNRDTNSQSFFLRLGLGDNKLSFGLNGIGGNEENRLSVSSELVLEKNIWYHIVGTYDGEVIKLYIDGTLENTNEGKIDFISEIDNILIGKQKGDGNPLHHYLWKGQIDDIAIWNRALTEEEANRLYEESFE
jgi:hypothetical protein